AARQPSPTPGARSSRPSACTEVSRFNSILGPLCDLGHSRNGCGSASTLLSLTFGSDCVIQGTVRAVELNDSASTRDESARSTCNVRSVRNAPPDDVGRKIRGPGRESRCLYQGNPLGGGGLPVRGGAAAPARLPRVRAARSGRHSDHARRQPRSGNGGCGATRDRNRQPALSRVEATRKPATRSAMPYPACADEVPLRDKDRQRV